MKDEGRKVCQIFFVSDGTGITAEVLGQSLLVQFPNIRFLCTTFPYIHSVKRADLVVETITKACQASELHMVVSTLVDPTIRAMIAKVPSRIIDLFSAFLGPIEEALHSHSVYKVGSSRSMTEDKRYQHRMDAIHFAMMNDDGSQVHQYSRADMILMGVSRSGKTPVCIYLALQFAVLVANYPMTEEDLIKDELPACLQEHRDKLFGLTIDPQRLSAIREERQPGSRYASLKQCQHEVSSTLNLMSRYHIAYLDTTHRSIEEIATTLLAKAGIQRHVTIA